MKLSDKRDKNLTWSDSNRSANVLSVATTLASLPHSSPLASTIAEHSCTQTPLKKSCNTSCSETKNSPVLVSSLEKTTKKGSPSFVSSPGANTSSNENVLTKSSATTNEEERHDETSIVDAKNDNTSDNNSHSEEQHKGSQDHNSSSTSQKGHEGCDDVNTFASAVQGGKMKFPVKLMILLEGGKGLEKYDGILSWSRDGRCFFINKPALLEKIVLPEYFLSEAGKLNSFLRKLYRWGFMKCPINSKKGRAAYSHQQFRRGNLKLCQEITFSRVMKPSGDDKLRIARRGSNYAKEFHRKGKKESDSSVSEPSPLVPFSHSDTSSSTYSTYSTYSAKTADSSLYHQHRSQVRNPPLPVYEEEYAPVNHYDKKWHDLQQSSSKLTSYNNGHDNYHPHVDPMSNWNTTPMHHEYDYDYNPLNPVPLECYSEPGYNSQHQSLQWKYDQDAPHHQNYYLKNKHAPPVPYEYNAPPAPCEYECYSEPGYHSHQSSQYKYYQHAPPHQNYPEYKRCDAPAVPYECSSSEPAGCQMSQCQYGQDAPGRNHHPDNDIRAPCVLYDCYSDPGFQSYQTSQCKYNQGARRNDFPPEHHDTILHARPIQNQSRNLTSDQGTI